MGDQLVAVAATTTTHNKQKKRTSIPAAGFELPILASKRPQTYVLDGTATAIGHRCC
jgi:hypothetical protein